MRAPDYVLSSAFPNTIRCRKRSANYSLAFKRQLAQRACDENVSVAQLALEHGLNTNMVFKWLRELRAGQLDGATALLPVSVTPNRSLEQSKSAVDGVTCFARENAEPARQWHARHGPR
jgi:transposase-like protein